MDRDLLYVIYEDRKGWQIILNQNYTDEELKEKLSDLVDYEKSDFHEKEWIEFILAKGVRIPEGEQMKFKVKDCAIIKMQYKGLIWKPIGRSKVIFHPDLKFDIIDPIDIRIIKRVSEDMDVLIKQPFKKICKKIKKIFSDFGDQRKREKER